MTSPSHRGRKLGPVLEDATGEKDSHEKSRPRPTSDARAPHVTSSKTRQDFTCLMEDMGRRKSASTGRQEIDRLRAKVENAPGDAQPSAPDLPRRADVTSSATRLELERLRAKLGDMGAGASGSGSPGSARGSGHRVPVTSSATRLELDRLKEKMARDSVSRAERERKLGFYEEKWRAESKERNAEIKTLVLKAQELDIAFLVDCTGSMEASIELVKREARTLVRGIQEEYPAAALRVAFVGYRDYGEETDVIDFTSDFVADGSAFVTALARVRAQGGADAPEDVFTGLEKAAALGWRAQGRLLVHIADAPCHGSEFNSGLPDNYPGGDARGRSVAALLHTLLADCHVSTYLFCHLNDTTRQMVAAFKRLVNGAGGSPGEDWLQDEAFLHLQSIVYKVVLLSRETINRTLSTVGRGGPAPKFVPEVVVPRVPNWGFLHRSYTALELKYKRESSLEATFQRIIKRELLVTEPVRTATLKIGPNPFSNDGAMRWPYYAASADVSTRSADVGDDVFVVKRFKQSVGDSPARTHSRERYLQQMEIQTVSAQLAAEFTARIAELRFPRKVSFAEVTMLEVEDGGGKKYYTKEPLLTGAWIKYSSNAGYVNTPEYRATLHAFSHWTFHVSHGLLMVTDLQGVRTSGPDGQPVFMLSDPAIHCTDVLRFSRTNLGDQGFGLFFNSHKCNDVCRALRLPAPGGQTSAGTKLASGPPSFGRWAVP